ncbi:MAG: hypothetical protein SFY67_01405 [Candidatus Melainabacteria bacterium]|nr:hypothetical protein [Candidatus Melainabacteria bacterium]
MFLEKLKSIIEKEQQHFLENTNSKLTCMTLVHMTFNLHSRFDECVAQSQEYFCDNQRKALTGIFSNLENEHVMVCLSLLRGHWRNMWTTGRRQVELCAFAFECAQNKESAKKWLRADDSKKKENSYKFRFPAHEIVRKHLSRGSDSEADSLYYFYDRCCMMVHPSLHSTLLFELDPGEIAIDRHLSLSCTMYARMLWILVSETAISNSKFSDFEKEYRGLLGVWDAHGEGRLNL